MSEDNMLNSSEEAAAPEGAQAPEAAQAATNTNEASWYSEDFSDLIESKGFKSADDVLKSYKNLEAMTGNSVRIPSDDASPEAKAEFLEKIKDMDEILIKGSEDFYTKLGRPEDSSEYDFKDVIEQDLYANVPGLDAELQDFQSIAHEAGLTNEQASKLVDMRMKTIEQQQAALDQQRESAEQQLKKQWGSDFDNRLAAAKQVVKIYGEKHGDAVNQLVNSAAGNNPVLLDMLSELGEMYKEKKHTGMQGQNFGLTPEMAQAKIAEKRADRGFLKAYQDSMDPGHKAAVEEMQRLYALANGHS